MNPGIKHTPSTREKYLRDLKDNIPIINPDVMPMIKKGYKKTELKTNLIFTLMDLNDHFISLDVCAKLRAIRYNFVDYIERKIQQIQPESLLVPEDPWEVMYPAKRDVDLMRAHDHIQDVLFACRQIVEQKLDEGVEAACKEIKELRHNNLSGYLDILQKAVDETNHEAIAKLTEKLAKRLKSLEKHLSAKEYEVAQKRLESIVKMLGDSKEKLQSCLGREPGLGNLRNWGHVG